jgi:hypothetical protein
MVMTNPKPLVFILITAVLILESAGLQDPGQYENLKDPRIIHMPSQKMLVVEAKGDPTVMAQEAFSKLFGTFFRLPGARMAPPRARWMNLASDPRSEWIGLYALPLPDTVTELPAGVEGVRIEEWKYGEVAEILHIGPYSEETPTIEKLHTFIREQGYEISGPHEEEYLKAPGMGSIGPEEYETIIRYPVKKN